MKKQTRETILKRIEALPATGERYELAKYGRVLPPIERKLKDYLLFKGEKFAGVVRARLGDALLEAIDSRDFKALRVIAAAVEHQDDIQQVGAYHADIIAMKGVLDECGQTMTIPYLAKLLRIQRTTDGFKALRTLCKRLKFPIKDAKRGPARAQS